MRRPSQELHRASSLPRSVQQNCYAKTFPRAASGILLAMPCRHPSSNAFPSTTAIRKPSQELRGVYSFLRSAQRNCFKKTFPRAALGILLAMLCRHPPSNAFPSTTAIRKLPKSCTGYPPFCVLPSGTALRRPSQELRQASSLRCCAQLNCNAMRRPTPSCVGHPSCNVFPSRPATRKPS